MDSNISGNSLARSYPAASTLSRERQFSCQVKAIKAEIVLQNEPCSSQFSSAPSPARESNSYQRPALEPILLQTKTPSTFNHGSEKLTTKKFEDSEIIEVSESICQSKKKDYVEEVLEIQDTVVRHSEERQDLEVAIKRGPDGLIGFAFEKEFGFTDEPYIIYDINPMKSAAKSGLLRVSDELHRVDGIEVHDLFPEQVAALIKGAAGTYVTLLIRR